MMLPVSAQVMLSELEGVKEIVDKWMERLAKGIPVLDAPGTEESLTNFLREMSGELRVAAVKCETLSDVFSGA